jgi:hypothetical protein
MKCFPWVGGARNWLVRIIFLFAVGGAKRLDRLRQSDGLGTIDGGGVEGERKGPLLRYRKGEGRFQLSRKVEEAPLFGVRV